jgi:conjugative transfer region protein (TIGR03750 family)
MSAGTFFDDDDGAGQAGAAPLTDRVNCEPPVLRGLSVSEVVVASALFFPLWFCLGFIAARLFHHWQILVILGIFGPLASVWASAGFLAGLKRNRPDHYYWQAWLWWLHRCGVWRVPFVSHHGAWDLGRSLPAVSRRSRASEPGRVTKAASTGQSPCPSTSTR